MPAHNPFKAALAARQAQVGLWLSMADPYLAEVSATAGFDWLLIDGEHAPNDLRGTLAALQTVAPYRSQPVVRVVAADTALIKQMLDIGAKTLLVPMVDTADQARALVAATRYPPQGMRGVAGAQRSNRYGTVPNYLQTINDNICVLLQIESRPGIEAVDEIASVEGVDGVFIGPSDLAAALGHLGNPGHPEVQEAIRHLYQRVTAQGKAVGILAPVHADARRYLDMGMHFVAVGTDLGVFKQATFALREAFPT